MTTRDFLDLPPVPADHVIAYGDDTNHYGWLTLPSNTDRLAPVAMLIHGGFWRDRFDLSIMSRVAADLADAGLAVWNIEYRRLGQPGSGYPNTGHDVKNALAYVQRLADAHPINPDRVVAVGHDAGGQLAAWLAATTKELKAAVLLGGVVDLRLGHTLDLNRGVVEELMGGSPDELDAAYRDFSPADYTTFSCPVEQFHGAADPHVPIELADRLVAASRGACTLHRFDEAGHFEFIDPSTPEYAAVRSAVLRHANP
jgi:acetyl esterase/lipase